ncbi:MAG: GTPase domain-containing protein [Thermodesulfovibrionales bacterium]|nr:GTPase domain-containing protein [Thermodesulfovibrionales bacterium]
MIEFDEVQKRMVIKLVYYGPAMSGKTTNLMYLHDVLDKKGRGELMTLDTQDDRTIFFDLLPFFLTTPSGLKIKLKVYTVPGQVRHDATRKAVLMRADGVAFIADSQVKESLNNAESFSNLEKNLSIVGIDIDSIPLVIQFNKRDLKDIIPEEDVIKTWKDSGIPIFFASALMGWGVVETFKCLLEMVYDHIDKKHQLNASHGLTKEQFVTQIIRISND